MLLKKKLSQDIHYLLVLLVVFTIPFGVLLNSYLIILLGINWLLDKTLLQRIRSIKGKAFFILFSSLYIIQVIGMLYTEDLTNGSLKLESKFSLLIMPFLFSTSQLSPKRTLNIVILFIATCTIISLTSTCIVLYKFRTSITYQFPSMDEFTGVLKVGHPYLGMYIVFSSFALLFLLINDNQDVRLRNKALAIFSFIILYLFLILIGARTAIICSILLFTIFIVHYIILKRKIIISIILFFLFGLSFSYILSVSDQLKQRLLPILNKDLNNNPLYVKSQTWRCGLSTFTASGTTIIAGVGTGDVKKYLLSCYDRMGFDHDKERQFNVHNEYIDEAARHGVIGLSIYLSCLFIPLILSIRKGKYLYSVFLTIIIIASITESILSIQKGAVFYSLFNSLLMFNYSLSKEKTKL